MPAPDPSPDGRPASAVTRWFPAAPSLNPHLPPPPYSAPAPPAAGHKEQRPVCDMSVTPVPGYEIYYPAYRHLPPSGYPRYPAGGLFWIDDRLDIRRRLLIQDIQHNTYPYIHIICYLIRRPVLDIDIRPPASYSGYRYIRRNTYPYYYPLSPAGGLLDGYPLRLD